MIDFSFTSLAVVVLAAVTLTCTSCGSSTGPDSHGGGEINDDLIKLEAALSDYPFWWMGAWTSRDEIYATAPLSRLHLSDSLSLRSVSTLILDGSPRYVEANEAGTKLLLVRDLYTRDVGSGPLFEREVQTGRMHTLRDSTYAVSSAVYLPGSNSRKLVYYSYGSSPEFGNEAKNLTPGYYVYDKATGSDSLLFAHRSEPGPSEVVNGFDVSPDGRMLLYPVNYNWHPPTYAPSPRAVAYDLETSTRDTLNLSFDAQILWFRYSADGQKLLYCNYERGAGGYTYTFHGPSEIGVVDLPTLQRHVLDTDTNPKGASLSIFPQWSASGQRIVFGSAPVARPSGAIGTYSLFILKNVN